MTGGASAIEINGMAHVILTVSQFDKALVNHGPDFSYHDGGRTAIGVRKCDPDFEGEKFQQYRVGLHHLCLRARSRDDVDKTAALAASLGAPIVRGPEECEWAPGYFYVLFEDPDGIRLELNFIPGAGLLKQGESFGSATDYVRVDGKDATGDA